MSDDETNDDLGRWVRIVNKGHGYAGVFNYENSDDKQIVEISTIEEWRKSVLAEFGIEMATPRANPQDPPDFFVSIADRELKVELVQLVDQDLKKRATKGETPFAGQLFRDARWSKEKFLEKLKEVIDKKGRKYSARGLEVDVLLIHTAEPWLTSIAARRWLTAEAIEAHPSIRSAFLLFEYEPGNAKHWPIIAVYGDPFQGISGDVSR